MQRDAFAFAFGLAPAKVVELVSSSGDRKRPRLLTFLARVLILAVGRRHERARIKSCSSGSVWVRAHACKTFLANFFKPTKANLWLCFALVESVAACFVCLCVCAQESERLLPIGRRLLSIGNALLFHCFRSSFEICTLFCEHLYFF